MTSLKWIVGVGALVSVAGVSTLSALQPPLPGAAPLPKGPAAPAGVEVILADLPPPVPLDGPLEGPMDLPGGDIRFCFPEILQGPAGCMAKRDLLGAADRVVDRITKEGLVRHATVKMVHPTDFTAPEKQVDSCPAYAALRGAGWTPLSSADRVDESRFIRFCGLLSMVRLASPARTTRFLPDGLSEREIAQVPAADWPTFGEPLDAGPVITADGEDPRRWQAESPTLRLVLQDVAHADFDGDGVGERLVFIAVRARGGSAGFAGYSLLEHEGDVIRLQPIRWR